METRQRPGLELTRAATYVKVEITDSGVGIDPEKREKIFEPSTPPRKARAAPGWGLRCAPGLSRSTTAGLRFMMRRAGDEVLVFLPAVTGPSPGSQTARIQRIG